METSVPHAILLASPGMGHIIPVVELAKRMVANHGFKVTLFAITTDSSLSQTQLISSLHIPQKELDIIVIPPIDISALIDSSTGIFTQLRIMMRQALPHLRQAVRLKTIPTQEVVGRTEIEQVVRELMEELKLSAEKALEEIGRERYSRES